MFKILWWKELMRMGPLSLSGSITRYGPSLKLRWKMFGRRRK